MNWIDAVKNSDAARAQPGVAEAMIAEAEAALNPEILTDEGSGKPPSASRNGTD